MKESLSLSQPPNCVVYHHVAGYLLAGRAAGCVSPDVCVCVPYLSSHACLFVRLCDSMEEVENAKQTGRCWCLFGCGSVTAQSSPSVLRHSSLRATHLTEDATCDPILCKTPM